MDIYGVVSANALSPPLMERNCQDPYCPFLSPEVYSCDMANFSQVPNEILLLVAKSLSSQKDINALVRTNWRLCHLLHAFLCDFNIQHHQSSGLLYTAGSGNSTLVKKFLNAGASIASFELLPDEDETDFEEFEKQDSPLLRAAQNGHVGLLNTMLSETNPSRACIPPQLRTVLHWAIETGNQVVVELMIAHQAPLGRPRVPGDDSTALSQALELRCGKSIIECILQTGWKPTALFPDPFVQATYYSGTSILQLLLRYNLRPRSTRILSHISRRGDTASLQILIDSGLDMIVYGHIALLVAIDLGHQPMVQLLIEAGANPHLSSIDTNWWYYSTIWHAVLYRQYDILKALVDNGVRPDYQDFQLAIDMNFLEAVALLEGFSYENIPKKMRREKWVQYWENKRTADPDFQRLE